MVVPQVYRKSGESPIASYDFFDLANNIGYKAFYPMVANAATTFTAITDANFRSLRLHVQGSASVTTAAFIETVAMTIDITFNTPQNLKGDMFINVPITTDRGDKIFRLVTQIFHVTAAAAETQLGSTNTSAVFEPGTAKVGQMALVQEDLGTQHFRAGESLRVKLSLEAKALTTTETTIGAIGTDPSNRTDIDVDLEGDAQVQMFTTGETSMRQIWFVPFKIDL